MSLVDHQFPPDPVTIDLADVELIPHVSGALWVPGFQTLLVADLHFEKASSYAVKGIHLPPYDTRKTFRLLEHVCELFRPKQVISLGDTFHDENACDRMDDNIVLQIRAFAQKYDVIWIAGNHDERPPLDVGGRSAQEFQLGPITLRHLPTAGIPLFPEIAGHLHPVAVVSQRGRRLRRRCFVCDGNRMIMPAFGSLTGGLNIRSDAFSEIFADRQFSAWLLGRDQVYRFGAKRLLGGG